MCAFVFKRFSHKANIDLVSAHKLSGKGAKRNIGNFQCLASITNTKRVRIVKIFINCCCSSCCRNTIHIHLQLSTNSNYEYCFPPTYMNICQCVCVLYLTRITHWNTNTASKTFQPHNNTRRLTYLNHIYYVPLPLLLLVRLSNNNKGLHAHYNCWECKRKRLRLLSCAVFRLSDSSDLGAEVWRQTCMCVCTCVAHAGVKS